MAAAKESQQFTDRNSSYLDNMAFPHLDKDLNLPYFPPNKCTANAALLGQYASDLPSLNTGQQNAVGGFRKLLPPPCGISNPTGDLYPKDLLCESHQTVEEPFSASLAPSQRRFLIFDQSENHTRLFFSPSFSPLDQIFASKTPASANGLFGKVATQVDQHISKEPIIEEKWDENHMSDGEDEMLEDSEEIDALLYSDSDDDDYDEEDGENDEVTSTRHSPLLSLEEGYDRAKLADELTEEEVASSDESPKRRKLLDGEYKKSSLESGGKPCSYEDDAESSCGDERNPYDGATSKRETKAKMRKALEMLESIIPGLDEKDPLSIIDGAVAYLKAMKSEAESLGLGASHGSSSTTTTTTSSRNHQV